MDGYPDGYPEVIFWLTAPAKREAGVFLALPISANALIEERLSILSRHSGSGRCSFEGLIGEKIEINRGPMSQAQSNRQSSVELETSPDTWLSFATQLLLLGWKDFHVWLELAHAGCVNRSYG